MRHLTLFEEASDGSVRLLGQLFDQDLVSEAAERLSAARRRELARLGAHLKAVPPAPEDGRDA